MTVMELIHEIYGEFPEPDTEAKREAAMRQVVIYVEELVPEEIIGIHEVRYDGINNRLIIETE